MTSDKLLDSPSNNLVFTLEQKESLMLHQESLRTLFYALLWSSNCIPYLQDHTFTKTLPLEKVSCLRTLVLKCTGRKCIVALLVACRSDCFEKEPGYSIIMSSYLVLQYPSFLQITLRTFLFVLVSLLSN